MVVDASVMVSRLVAGDVNHEASRRWLDDHIASGGLLIAPALLLPELAGAIARRTNRGLARRAIAALLRLPELRVVAIDARLAEVAARLAGDLHLRGADAVYVATAAHLRLPLVTWDAEQRERGAARIRVMAPDTSRRT
jgi:predicted nucleic acid-binding protein